MESTPSKRRKVSPARSIPIDALNTDLHVRDKQDARASFMSPTKASLSRFNPDILTESRSAGNGHRESDFRVSPRRLNPTALRPLPDKALGRLSASPVRELSLSPSRRPHADPLADTIVLAPASEAEKEVEQSLVEEERLAQAVRRSARRTRGNRLSFLPTPTEETQEPELPPTPEQLGVEKRPQPPEGLLSSSPSHKMSKRKGASYSSPLKPKDLPNKQPSEEQASGVARQANQGPAPEPEEVEDDPEVVERREQLAQLSAQLQSLKSDVAFLEEEVQQSQNEGVTQSSDQGHLERLLYAISLLCIKAKVLTTLALHSPRRTQATNHFPNLPNYQVSPNASRLSFPLQSADVDLQLLHRTRWVLSQLMYQSICPILFHIYRPSHPSPSPRQTPSTSQQTLHSQYQAYKHSPYTLHPPTSKQAST